MKIRLGLCLTSFIALTLTPSPFFSALPCLACFQITETNTSRETTTKKTLLSVQGKTVLHPVSPTSRQGETILQKDTLLVGIERKKMNGVLNGDYWIVQNPKSPKLSGLVSAKMVVPVTEKVEQEIARAEEARQQTRKEETSATDHKPAGARPDILNFQGDRLLAEAWDNLSKVIEENESLPESERLPEPYLARASIWSRLERHSEAALDYFKAVKYAQASGRDLQELSVYFKEINKSLANFSAIPAPPHGKENLYHFSAVQHFDRGIIGYLEGDYERAREHLDNAIQLLPDSPAHWYGRAICYRSLGDGERAQHDALMGALMERRLSPGKSQSVNWRLTRIQGPDRVWIEGFRLGGKSLIHAETKKQ